MTSDYGFYFSKNENDLRPFSFLLTSKPSVLLSFALLLKSGVWPFYEPPGLFVAYGLHKYTPDTPLIKCVDLRRSSLA